MPALQVKDCPQGVIDQLRLCAANEDRSMAQQTVHILKRYLRLYQENRRADDPEAAIFAQEPEDEKAKTERERQARIKEREELFAKIRAQKPIIIPEDFPSAVEIIRQGREERTARIMPEGGLAK